MSFKYERLHNLCYWCGCLDNDNRECVLWIESKGTLLVIAKQFESFMRANQVFTLKNSVVHISGYFDDRKDKHPNTRYKLEVRTQAPATEVLVTGSFATVTTVNCPDLETPRFAEDVIILPNSNSNKPTVGTFQITLNSSSQTNLTNPFFQQLLDID